MNRLSKEAHAIEEINGAKCAIVEKNVTPERVEFLKKLLEHNGYTVMVALSPPPKVAPAKPAAPPVEGQPAEPPAPVPPPPPETFTIGVTDLLFHALLLIYERSLKTPEGKIVSIDYWNQQPEKEGEYYWKRGFFTNSL